MGKIRLKKSKDDCNLSNSCVLQLDFNQELFVNSQIHEEHARIRA